MGYCPLEIYKWTIGEVNDALLGLEIREWHEWKRVAFATAHMLNISGCKVQFKKTPDSLLGGGAIHPMERKKAKAGRRRARLKRRDGRNRS